MNEFFETPFTDTAAQASLQNALARFIRESDKYRRLTARVRESGWLIPLRDAGLIARVNRDGTYQVTLLGKAWQAGTETKTLEQLTLEAKRLCRLLGKRRVLVFIYGQEKLYRLYESGTATMTNPTEGEKRYTDARMTLGQLWEAAYGLQTK